LLGADSAACPPGSLEFAVVMASNASGAPYSSSAARVAWNAAMFQRPPPLPAVIHQVWPSRRRRRLANSRALFRAGAAVLIA